MSSVKQRVAMASIAVTVGITAAKLIVGLLSGSLAILAEAAHGIVDIGATILTYFAVRLADKPADEEHQYGHGKVEPLAALAETAFLFLVSGIVIGEAIRRLGEGGQPIEITWAMIGLLVLVILVDFVRMHVLRRVAQETGSQALESGALHFAADLMSSMVVLAGLAFVWLGYPQADAIAAIIVAALICVMSLRLARRTIDVLMDRAPRGASEAIRAAVERVPGVVRTSRVRTRQVGETTLAEIVVQVSRSLPLERVSVIKSAVATAAGGAHVRTVPSVTADPIALDDETVLERVHVIARNEALAVHHVTVQHIDRAGAGDRLAVGLDLEVDGSMTLGEAHEVATRLETAIRDEMGVDVEVDTHIEPLQVETLAGRDCASMETLAMTEALADLALKSGVVGDIHNVRARETGAGVIVHYHCRVLQTARVSVVHDLIDEIERRFRARFSSVIRVVGHAEPHQDAMTASPPSGSREGPHNAN